MSETRNPWLGEDLGFWTDGEYGRGGGSFVTAAEVWQEGYAAGKNVICDRDPGDEHAEDFPKDSDGKPLAWPDPDAPGWYVDAWNGIYTSRAEALADSKHWVADESERFLSYGETTRSRDGEVCQ